MTYTTRPNRYGATFTARLVRTGDSYGRDDCLTNTGGPMIEFYDRRHMHTEYGQFVSRYNVDDITGDAGLCLDTGSRAWVIDGPELQEVLSRLVP